MARVVCFIDTNTIEYAMQQAMYGSEHDVYLLSASHLTCETRAAVCDIAPDIILLELTRALDNAHLYFFLRADQCTRDVPIILISGNPRLDQQAAILQADSFIQCPFEIETLLDMIITHAPLKERSVAA
jgi:CheY-like chemotaxis protein